jgi:hypothetical protein
VPDRTALSNLRRLRQFCLVRNNDIAVAEDATASDQRLLPRPIRIPQVAGTAVSGRIAQLEPMGREILYVVGTDAGYLWVLEHGSIAAYTVGEPDRIGFSPDDSLVFDAASQRLLGAARVGPPT